MSIIIKPIITEKMTAQAEKLNRYGFIVDKKADKLQIRKELRPVVIRLLRGDRSPGHEMRNSEAVAALVEVRPGTQAAQAGLAVLKGQNALPECLQRNENAKRPGAFGGLFGEWFAAAG